MGKLFPCCISNIDAAKDKKKALVMSEFIKDNTRVSQYRVTNQPKTSENLESVGDLSRTEDNSKQQQRGPHTSSFHDDLTGWLCCLCFWRNCDSYSNGCNCCCCDNNGSGCCDCSGCDNCTSCDC